MEDDSIDVSNVISNVVRAVGAMSGELVFFLFVLIKFISFVLVAFWFLIFFCMIVFIFNLY